MRVLALALLAFLDVGAAASDVRLEAELAWQGTAEASGLVAPMPATQRAYGWWWPTGDAPTGPFLEAGSSLVILHRWERIAGLPNATERYSQPLHTLVKTLHVEIEAVHPDVEIAMADVWPTAPRDAWRLDAMGCVLDHVGPFEPPWTPIAKDLPDARGAFEAIQAECEVRRLDATGPDALRINGLTLDLHLPDEDRVVRTGTWRTPIIVDAAALPSGTAPEAEIHQVLEIVATSAGARRTTLEGPARMRLAAEALIVDGALSMPSSVGRLAWGDLRVDGDVDPIRADGLFRVAAQPGESHVKGQAGPPPAAVAPAPASVGPMPVVLAAGALAAFLAWFLFSKLSKAAVERHPWRIKILALVKSRPGVTVGEVGHALGLKWPHVAHHVGHLRRTGLVTEVRAGRRISLFASGSVPPATMEAAALFRRPGYAAVHETVRASPGIDQAGLVARVGLSQPRISRILAKLERFGGTVRSLEGGRYRFYPPDLAPTGPSTDPTGAQGGHE